MCFLENALYISFLVCITLNFQLLEVPSPTKWGQETIEATEDRAIVLIHTFYPSFLHEWFIFSIKTEICNMWLSH
ncbi:hypothetical protein NQ315_003407 [Exocentrus adspersus]|uniref:Secreted protein n=1 Tax=Exocentrus adspersus TaxID=1586481 RepID=A0AAV8VN19_9CUCU|nr:hypothetical protein NQ315_003407 [Exocentrus adspersus]